ncbi:MAG: DUF938 domain-containing protein [Chromatocurvus sp.]
MMDELPFSPACENNKGPILEHLRDELAGARGVLEIGSGTGQHAVWFAGHLPRLTWQPTELPQSLAMLRPRCSASGLDNLLPPRAMDVCDTPWPLPVPDTIFTANTLHIMPMSSVQALFDGLRLHAPPGARLVVYGPFNYAGQYTSASNAQFDKSLRARAAHSGIRDIEAIDRLAQAAGFRQQADHAMPANNRLILWRRQDAPG